MIKKFNDFISEGRYRQFKHMWANPIFNKKELKEYDSLDTCFEKVKLAAEMLATNHKADLEISYDTVESSEVVTFMFFNPAGPLEADLKMFAEEIGECVEIPENDFATYMIYHIKDAEEYQKLVTLA